MCALIDDHHEYLNGVRSNETKRWVDFERWPTETMTKRETVRLLILSCFCSLFTFFALQALAPEHTPSGRSELVQLHVKRLLAESRP